MVYVDLVMGLNFAVDLLLLLGANALAGFPLGLRRCIRAAAVGGVYSGFCLIPGFTFLGKGLWQLVVLALMAVLAYGLNAGALRRGVLFTLISMALGGIALAVGSGGFMALIAATAGVFLMCCLGFRGTKPGQRFSRIRLVWGERSVLLTALHDTGNTLRDPVTGEGVLVVGAEIAKSLLGIPPEVLSKPVEHLQAIPGSRLIPYRAVGMPAGMLLAMRLEQVTDDGARKHAIVAFAPHRIGNEGYQGLMGGAR